MAEATLVRDPAPAADPAPEPPSSRRRLLLAVLVVVLLAGGSAAAWSFGLVGGAPAEATPAEPPPPTEGAVVEVAELTTSIGGAPTGYVRLGFAAVLVEDASEEEVAERYPLLRDAALTVLSRYTAEQLRTQDGIAQVRADLTAAAREVYPDGEVLRIVLTNLLVQ